MSYLQSEQIRNIVSRLANENQLSSDETNLFYEFLASEARQGKIFALLRQDYEVLKKDLLFAECEIKRLKEL